MVLHHLQIYDAEPILTYRHITDIIAIKTGSAFTLFHSLIHGIDEHRTAAALRIVTYLKHLFLAVLLPACRIVNLQGKSMGRDSFAFLIYQIRKILADIHLHRPLPVYARIYPEPYEIYFHNNSRIKKQMVIYDIFVYICELWMWLSAISG